MKPLKVYLNIFEAATPAYYLFKFFGVISFYFERPVRSGIMKTSMYDRLYLLLLLICHSAAFYGAYDLITTLDIQGKFVDTHLIAFAYECVFYGSIFTKMINIIYFHFNSLHIQKFLNILHDFDLMSLSYGCINSKKQNKFSIALIIMSSTYMIVFQFSLYFITSHLSSNYSFNYHKMLSLIFGFYIWLELVFVFPFIKACAALKIRFKLLNDYLR